jgi:hypothetical protein
MSGLSDISIVQSDAVNSSNTEPFLVSAGTDVKVAFRNVSKTDVPVMAFVRSQLKVHRTVCQCGCTRSIVRRSHTDTWQALM